MKYRKASELIDEVVDQLHSWFDHKKVDQSILYPVLNLCITRMGGKILPNTSTILEIKGGRAKLPDDFHSLDFAVLCYGMKVEQVNPRYGEQFISEKVECLDVCDNARIYVDECGKASKLVQILPFEVFEWDEFEYLRAARVTQCSADCPNIGAQSENEFEINDGYMVLNVNCGTVFIQYCQTIQTSAESLVPDQDTITQWIKDAMIFEVFKVLLYNGEQVTTQYGAAKQELFVSEQNARGVYKGNEVSAFYELRNELVRRYNRFANPVINDTRYSGSHYW